MGLMILAAANAVENGANAAEANERAEAVRAELKIWFAVDTLDYLRRGGRIGAARAWIGTTLKIKPILTLEEEITPVERVRTRSRSIERLIDYARQREEAGADAWVVQHVQDPENAEQLVEACRPIFGRDPIFTSEVGPVIGAHVGPGLLGVGGVSWKTLEGR
jgi:DegV family protein with EDD domain